MKTLFKSFALIAYAVLLLSCGNNDGEVKITTDLITNPATASGEEDHENLPRFEFAENTYDFGTISQGEMVSYSYKFKNVGKTDLIISSAKGSCGCTVPEYPKKPIPPGGEGKIEVVFDSEGKSGKQSKTVTLLANTYPATTILTISGEIKAPVNN
jgi:hypothetical protein